MPGPGTRADQEKVVVGYVRRAHGIEGELLVHLETDYPRETFLVDRVFRITENAPIGLPADLTLERARPHGSSWILAFREIPDRTLAERYGGAHLTLERDELVEVGEAEYFLHDLVDLEVVDEESGERIGTVTGVYDTPGRPILAVETDGDEALVPFERSFVTGVDLDEETLRIRLPEGLLEL